MIFQMQVIYWDISEKNYPKLLLIVEDEKTLKSSDALSRFHTAGFQPRFFCRLVFAEPVFVLLLCQEAMFRTSNNVPKS